MPLEIGGLAPLLQVFDMQESVQFYRRLGFDVVSTSGEEDFNWALLRRDGVEIMLNTAYEPGRRPDVRDSARTKAHSDTMLFFACPDVDDAYRFVQSQGLTAAQPVTRDYGMRQMTMRDPDGFILCFQHRA
jgi:glyoxylase I family protein